MAQTYRYNPRHKMLKELERVLANSKEDSEVRKLIAMGFAHSALESEILPNVGMYPRSKEGAMNVTEVVLACMENAPEASADLAESLVRSGRLSLFTTGILLKLLGG